MKKSEIRTLIIGIGNCERGDDGLGWAFLDAIKGWIPDHFDVVYHYQLQVEDAEIIRYYDLVIFVDAYAKTLPGGFDLFGCEPKPTSQLTSHELEPGEVLYLADTIYGDHPKAYTFLISGYDFELGHLLSEKAEENLSKAVKYFEIKMGGESTDLMLSDKKELRIV